MGIDKPIQITLYHAKWCGHCVNFMPIWETMKSNPKNKKKINFVAVEDTELNIMSAGSKPNIEGFPTIKINIKGKEHNYNGSRNEKDIFEHILNRLKGVKIYTTTDEHTITPMSDNAMKGGINNIYNATMNDMKKTITQQTHSIFTPVSAKEHSDYNMYSAPSTATTKNTQEVKYAPRLNLKF